MKYWIRRGYGPFVQCASEVKARQKAKHWHENGQGGSEHPVIGLFKAQSFGHLMKGFREYIRLY